MRDGDEERVSLERFLIRWKQGNGWSNKNAWIDTWDRWRVYVRVSQRKLPGHEGLVKCLDIANAVPEPDQPWTSAVAKAQGLRLFGVWVCHAEDLAKEFGLSAVYLENVLTPSFYTLYSKLGYVADPNGDGWSLFKNVKAARKE